MGKKSKQKQEVTDYLMSLHFGICAGPVDAIKAIYIGEKLAWEGSVSAETSIPINQPSLFGGPKKEGGTVGTAYYLPGGASQVMPDILAARFGRTAATSPGFRGISSLFFVGEFIAPAPVFAGWYLKVRATMLSPHGGYGGAPFPPVRIFDIYPDLVSPLGKPITGVTEASTTVLDYDGTLMLKMETDPDDPWARLITFYLPVPVGQKFYTQDQVGASTFSPSAAVQVSYLRWDSENWTPATTEVGDDGPANPYYIGNLFPYNYHFSAGA